MILDDSPYTFRNAIVIPVIQAIITGLILGSFSYYTGYSFQFAEARRFALITGFLTAAIVWLSHLSMWRGTVKLPGPNPAPEPEPRRVFRAEIVSDTNPVMRLIEIEDIDEIQFITFARRIARNLDNTNEESWTGPGGIFTRSQYKKLRDEFISRGLAQWRQHRNQGWEFTRPGKAFIRFAASPTPPATGPELYRHD